MARIAYICATMKLKLSISSIAHPRVDEEVTSVQLPGVRGRFAIYPGHAPLMAVLQRGEVVYSQEGKPRRRAISAGVVRVKGDNVSLLVW